MNKTLQDFTPSEEIMRSIIESHIVSSDRVILPDPQMPRYACFVVLRKHCGEILLARRNTNPHFGQLSAIGGKVDKVLANPGSKMGSSFTKHLDVGGFEAPWAAAVRELREEAFQALTAEALGEQLGKATKLGIVYDAQHNAYCRIYLVDILDNATFTISVRELMGEPVVVTADMFNTAPGINDMTAILLLHHGLIPTATLDLNRFNAAPIHHVFVPQDGFSFASTLKEDPQARIQMSHVLRDEPGYIIHIPSSSVISNK